MKTLTQFVIKINDTFVTRKQSQIEQIAPFALLPLLHSEYSLALSSLRSNIYLYLDLSAKIFMHFEQRN